MTLFSPAFIENAQALKRGGPKGRNWALEKPSGSVGMPIQFLSILPLLFWSWYSAMA